MPSKVLTNLCNDHQGPWLFNTFSYLASYLCYQCAKFMRGVKKKTNKFVEFKGRAEIPNGMLMNPLKLSTNRKIYWIKISKVVDIFIPSHGTFHDMVELIFLFTPCCVSSRSVLTHRSRSCSNGFSSLQLPLRTNSLPVTQTKLTVAFSIIRQYI